MTREEKAKVIESLVEKFKNTTNFYITDTGGFTVAQINDFRRECFKAGIEYKVYKNTLIEKALEQLDTDYTSFSEQKVLKGSSGVMFSPESPNQPAKLIKSFRKKANLEKPLLKGASVDSALFIGDDQLNTLAQMKSKDELIGDVITLLQSPAKNVVSALKGQGGKLAGILKTLSEREG